MTAKWRWLAALLLTGGILAATLPATLGQDKKADVKAVTLAKKLPWTL